MQTYPDDFTNRSRTKAMGIRRRLGDMGIEASLAQAYEALAASEGHRNWATMKALCRAGPVARAVPPDLLSSAELDEFVDEINRREIFERAGLTPRNRALLLGGTRESRRAIAADVAKRVGRDVMTMSAFVRTDAFLDRGVGSPLRAPHHVVFVDDLSDNELTHDVVSWLCVQLDDAAPSDIVILGTDRGAGFIDRRLLRRVHVRVAIDR